MEHSHDDSLEAMYERAWRITAAKWIEGLTGQSPIEIWDTITQRTQWAVGGAEREWERVVNEFMPPPQIVNEPIESAEETPSYVYAIQAESGWIKIGTTTSHPKARMRSLQTGHPERLRLLCYFPGDRTIEGQMHRQLDEYRKHGEWFEPALIVLGGLWLWHDQFWEEKHRETYGVGDKGMIL